MADNYIEKKMDDYRRGVLSRHNPQVSRSVTAGISHKTSGPRLCIFVIGGCDGHGPAIIKSLCASGHKVAFSAKDLKAGRELSQATGSQHHSIDSSDKNRLLQSMRYVESKWGKIDIVINSIPSLPIHPPPGATLITVTPPESYQHDNDAAIANLTLELTETITGNHE